MGDGAERGYAFCIFAKATPDAEIVEVRRLEAVYLSQDTDDGV